MVRRTLRFKHRLSLVFFLLGLGMTLVTLFVIEHLLSQQLLQARSGELHFIAHNISKTLNDNLNERRKDIHLLADDALVATLSGNPSELRHHLELLKATQHNYAWIGLTNSTGVVLAATGGLLEGRDVSRRPWFAAAQKKDFIGDVHEASLLADLLGGKDQKTPLRFIDLSSPISDPQGNLRGVLGAHIDWNWADQLVRSTLDDVKGSEDLQVFILDRNGQMLYPFSANANLQMPLGWRKGTWDDQLEWSGERVLLAQSELLGSSREALGWQILVRQSRSSALGDMAQVDRDMVLTGVIAIFLWALIGALTARRLAAPLEQLARIAQQMDNDPKAALTRASTVSEVNHLSMSLQNLNAARHLEIDNRTRAVNEANLATGRFLANMSHEIRTPMGSVVGLARLLMRTELTAQQRDYLERIHLASSSLLGLLNDILDHSRVESGKLQLEELPFRLQVVLDQCSALFSSMAEEKGLMFSVTATRNVPQTLIGDPMRLLQVLNNLVSNAIKFTERGRVTVDARLTWLTPDQAGIEISVEDSGIGLSEEAQSRLFTPFEQADNSIARRFGGSGLGLSISRQLVELMGGQLTVNSQPERGSTFSAALTFKLPESSTDGDAAPHVSPAPLLSDEFSGLQERLAPIHQAEILVVDDNSSNRLIAQEYLLAMGLRVTACESGEAAVATVKERAFAAVLMDLQMPGMDGFTATGLIVADQPELPVIALTASATSEDRSASLKAGMVDHLVKPLRPGDLADCLLKWVGQRGVVSVSAGVEPSHPPPAPPASRSRVQASFLQDFAHAPEEIGAALAKGDSATAIRLVHTIRGLLAVVGGDTLKPLADRFEQELKDGESGSLAEFSDTLRQLLGRLSEQRQDVTQEALTPSEPETPENSLPDSMAQLAKALREGRASARPLAMHIAARLRDPQAQAAFLPVMQAILRFDFEEALGYLNPLLGSSDA